jgi:hypothetical protein
MRSVALVGAIAIGALAGILCARLQSVTGATDGRGAQVVCPSPLPWAERLRKLAEERSWEVEYAGLTQDELIERRGLIQQVIIDATSDVFDQLFASGNFEVLGNDSTYQASAFDPTAVYRVRIEPSGRVSKATLPESEYPSVYELKALSAWLRQKIR